MATALLPGAAPGPSPRSFVDPGLLLLALAACGGDKPDGSGTDSARDSGSHGDSPSDDTGPDDSGPDDSGPDDTGPDDSSPDDSDPTDTADSVDTGETGQTADPCAELGVSFTAPDGSTEDLSVLFAAGTAESPAVIPLREGSYGFCPGTWYVALSVDGGSVALSALSPGVETVLDGAGLVSVLQITGDASVSLRDLTVAHGVASALSEAGSLAGGAVACAGESTLAMDGAILRDNQATVGGGIYSADCAVLIEDSELIGNTADFGGAIFAGHGRLRLTSSALTDNSASSTGGAIDLEGLDGEVLVELDDTRVEGNTSLYGGGIALWGAASARCTTAGDGGFGANTAELGGGVMLSSAEAGTPSLVSVGCGWGEGADDNSPDDVYIVDEALSYADYGTSAVFTCDHVSCG